MADAPEADVAAALARLHDARAPEATYEFALAALAGGVAVGLLIAVLASVALEALRPGERARAKAARRAARSLPAEERLPALMTALRALAPEGDGDWPERLARRFGRRAEPALIARYRAALYPPGPAPDLAPLDALLGRLARRARR